MSFQIIDSAKLVENVIDDKYDGGTDQDRLLFVVNCESLGYSSHNLGDSFIRLRFGTKTKTS